MSLPIRKKSIITTNKIYCLSMLSKTLFSFSIRTLPVSFTGDDFQCPVCRGRGDDPKADCDKKIKFESCNRANAICESTLYSYGTFVRQCSDTHTYETALGYCKEKNNCKKVMCKKSKCKADFPLGTILNNYWMSLSMIS